MWGAVAAFLWGALGEAMRSLVGRALIALGIGTATFAGVQAGLTAIHAEVITMISGAPTVALQVMGICRVGMCISIIFSAFVARATVRGLSAGVVKKFVKV